MNKRAHSYIKSPERARGAKNLEIDTTESNKQQRGDHATQRTQNPNSEKAILVMKQPILNEIIKETESSGSSDDESSSKSIKSQGNNSPDHQDIAVPNMNQMKRRSSASRILGGILESTTLRTPLRTITKRRRSSLDTNLLMHIKSLKAQQTKDTEQIEVITWMPSFLFRQTSKRFHTCKSRLLREITATSHF